MGRSQQIISSSLFTILFFPRETHRRLVCEWNIEAAQSQRPVEPGRRGNGDSVAHATATSKLLLKGKAPQEEQLLQMGLPQNRETLQFDPLEEGNYRRISIHTIFGTPQATSTPHAKVAPKTSLLRPPGFSAFHARTEHGGAQTRLLGGFLPTHPIRL